MDITIIDRKKSKRDVYDNLVSVRIEDDNINVKHKQEGGKVVTLTINKGEYDTVIIRRDD